MGLGRESALLCVSEEGLLFTFLESASGSLILSSLISALSKTVPLST
jgi:hypothetical protein